MTELQIIGAPQSHCVWVTLVTCTEKGVPYTLVPARPHTPPIDAIHPVGKMPVMRHGAVTLAESRAICLYVDRVFTGPSLIPADPVRAARVEQWVSIVNTHVEPVLMRQYAVAYLFPQTPDGSPDRSRIDPVLAQMESQLRMLDQAVAHTGYLADDAFSLADAYLMPILFYMNQLPESARMLSAANRLKAYFERHLQRHSVAATIPPPLPGRELRVAS